MMCAYWVLTAIMGVAIFSISSDHVLAGNRFALVIGNANYKNYSQTKMATPDATDIGAILEQSRFRCNPVQRSFWLGHEADDLGIRIILQGMPTWSSLFRWSSDRNEWTNYLNACGCLKRFTS